LTGAAVGALLAGGAYSVTVTVGFARENYSWGMYALAIPLFALVGHRAGRLAVALKKAVGDRPVALSPGLEAAARERFGTGAASRVPDGGVVRLDEVQNSEGRARS
jgi:hypothetical protein